MRGSVSVNPSRRRCAARGPTRSSGSGGVGRDRSRRGSGSRAFSGRLEGDPAPDLPRAARGARGAGRHQKAYPSSSLLEEREKVLVGVAGGAREIAAADAAARRRARGRARARPAETSGVFFWRRAAMKSASRSSSAATIREVASSGRSPRAGPGGGSRSSAPRRPRRAAPGRSRPDPRAASP